MKRVDKNRFTLLASLRASFSCVANQCNSLSKVFSGLLRLARKDDIKNFFKLQSTNHLLKKAFTLVELAIVLVIIGLLIGGVVGGQSLIKSSKRQKIITTYNSYNTAIKAFQLEYDALPGDFREATSYWPAKSDCITDTDSTKTCNGDGDKLISSTVENVLANQHLSLAKIIQGSYSGTGTVMGAYRVINPGVNSPNIMDGVTITMWHNPSASLGWSNTNIIGTFNIVFGKVDQAVNPHPWVPFLEGKESYLLDKKADDGAPGTGTVRTHVRGGCTTTGDALTSTYMINNPGINCGILYVVYGM